MKKIYWKKYIMNVTPLFGLLALFAAFLVLGTYQDINISYGLKSIINQSVVVAVVATGAIFIYTLGSFDISLGASVAVSALLGGMVYNRTESLLIMTAVCIGAAVKGLNNTPFKIVVLALFFLLSLFIFSFTKIGRMQKFQGGNPVCAKLSGIKEKKMAIIAFAMSGIGVGLGAFLSIIYAPTLTKNTASSVGMDVIIAIVFGGMPVSGGARSKIYAAVVGAFSMTLLSQIMVMFNLNSGIGQMVKAAIFLLVVFLATSDQRGKMLPR